MRNHLYVVILAGGSGTRFWPLSRRHKPKQFLKIAGDKTLLELTIERIKSTVPAKNIYIVTNKIYEKDILAHTRKYSVPSQNVLYEPQGKNTAPAILWAAHLIDQKDKNALMAVFPSDHLIQDKGKFLRTVGEAFRLAQKGHLVTLGIVPTRPETGYGYLKTSRHGKVLKVDKFTEKPDLKKAKRFVQSKNYFWNSGMFFWKVSVLLSAYKKYLPKMHLVMTTSNSNREIINNWSKLESISVDYGILERAHNVAAIPAGNIGWSDVGSWEALAQVLSPDKNQNVHRGDILHVQSRNNLIFGAPRMIAAIGISDLIVIDTPDALLICRKEHSQKVKDIVDSLKQTKAHLT